MNKMKMKKMKLMELQISNTHIFNKENSLTYNFPRFNYFAITKEFK